MEFIPLITKIVFIIVGLSVVLSVGLVSAAIISWKMRLARYKLLDDISGFPVRFATEARFRSLNKFFPWEGIGILSVRGGVVTLHALPNRGEAFEVAVSSSDILNYGTRSWLKNGLIHWLRLGRISGDIFVCPETGPTVFGSGRLHQEIMKEIAAEQGAAKAVIR